MILNFILILNSNKLKVGSFIMNVIPQWRCVLVYYVYINLGLVGFIFCFWLGI